MGNDEFRKDEDRISSFCASRGHGNEIKSYLLERARERNVGFDRLAIAGDSYRFEPVTDQQLEQWLVEMPEGPTLF